MVTGSPSTARESGGRGQVVLVGALAIAFVIVGLAVLFNAVTYTGQTAMPEAGSSIDDANQFDFESRRGSREVVLRVNHAGVYETESNLARNVSANVSNYSAIMGAAYSSHGAGVNVSFENTTSEYGRRIVQHEPRSFTKVAGANDWQLVDESDTVGWFVVTVNGTDLAENPSNAFAINVTNDTGEYVAYRIHGKGGGVVNVTVDTSVGAGGLYQINTTRGHVVLDLLDGTSPMNRSARMPPIRRLDGPYTIKFENGDRGRGLYSIVVPGEGPIENVTDCATSPTPSPCHGPAIWNVTVETHYQSPTINVSHNHSIPVYNSTS